MSLYRGIISFIILLITLVSCKKYTGNDNPAGISSDDTATDTRDISRNLLYGIPVDSFNLVPGYFKRNDFLSEILIDHGVSMQEINQITANSDDIFNVRSIRSGNTYILFCEKDSTARARYLVYEHDDRTCYIFSLRDSLNITAYNKEITRKVRYSSVTIETSLWDAVISEGLDPDLAIELSDIYAWTVDFFGLQKGDNFKIIYEDLLVGDNSLGFGTIYGAQFNSQGTTVTAIPFIQDSTETFFDEEGNSLRKAFLKAPLHFTRISSRFSSSRMHPILRIRRPHFGVDYVATIGTPVHSVGDGRVISVKTESGSGRIIRIQHNSVYSTAYMHLNRFRAGISAGDYVKQGEIIGYVGSSGLSTGPHLDFRFYMNGSPVDPLKVEAPPVEPVSDNNREKFEKICNVTLTLLHSFD